MTTPVTAIARSVDLDLPSNRLPVLAAAVTAVVATVVMVIVDAEAGLASAAGFGARAGVGVFLAWAIARELDPDRPLAARNAVLLALPVLAFGAPALAGVAALLLAARVLVRSTGRPPTTLDLTVLVGLAGFASTSAAGFVAALALAWAVHDDARLPDPTPQLQAQIAALIVGVAAVTVSVLTGSFLTDWRGPTALELVWIALVVVAVVVRPRAEVTTSDDRGGHLSTERVVRARLVVAVALAAALLWAGADAVPALAPAAAAILGLGITAPRWLGARDLGTPLDPPPGAAP